MLSRNKSALFANVLRAAASDIILHYDKWWRHWALMSCLNSVRILVIFISDYLFTMSKVLVDRCKGLVVQCAHSLTTLSLELAHLRHFFCNSSRNRRDLGRCFQGRLGLSFAQPDLELDLRDIFWWWLMRSLWSLSSPLKIRDALTRCRSLGISTATKSDRSFVCYRFVSTQIDHTHRTDWVRVYQRSFCQISL